MVVDSNTSLPDSTHQTYRYWCQKEGTFSELLENHTHPSHLGSWGSGICCTTRMSRVMHAKASTSSAAPKKKEKKKARVDWGSNCWRAKRTKKMKSIGYEKRKKQKKAFFLPRLLLLPPPLPPHSSPVPFFCPVSCILNLPIRHLTALASSSHAN